MYSVDAKNKTNNTSYDTNIYFTNKILWGFITNKVLSPVI